MSDDYDGFLVTLGGQTLTGVDDYGVEWMGIDLAGWYGASGTSLSPTQKTRAPGAWKGAAPQHTPKAIPLTGQLLAPSPDAARDAVDRLNAALDLDGSLLEVTMAGLRRFQVVTQSDEPLPKFETDTLVIWSLGVTALDPRKLGADLTLSTGLPAQSGGLTIPFRLPVAINASTRSGQVTLTNPGNTTGRVVVRFTGPCVAPRVLHAQSGLTVSLPGLTLGPGEYVDVDMEAKTVLANGGVSRNRQITQRGWSGFLPGDNTWAFLADQYSATASMTVTATPSWK
jgi:hypothetical protein